MTIFYGEIRNLVNQKRKIKMKTTNKYIYLLWLFVIYPVFATNPATGPNNVYLEQIGNSNTVTVEQIGGTNNIGGVTCKRTLSYTFQVVISAKEEEQMTSQLQCYFLPYQHVQNQIRECMQTYLDL